MTVLPTLPEKLDELNRHPVNQLAKKFLLKAGVRPDLSLLHAYQLMHWALSEGKVRPEGPANKYAAEDLLSMVERLMLLNNQEKAQKFLLNWKPDPENPAPWVDPEDLAQEKSPEDAAAYLLEKLQGHLEDLDPSPPRE
jgi:hypothetical protein